MMAMLIREIYEQSQVLSEMIQKYPFGYRLENLNSKKFFLFGTGASLSACMQAKYAFLRYAGINAVVVPACESSYYMNVLDDTCLVVIISQSGESYETKIISRQLEERGIPYVAITNSKTSYLASHAACTIGLEAGEELGTATKTQTSSVMMLYLIAASGSEQVLKQVRRIPNCLEKTLESAKEYRERLTEWLGDSMTVYLAGLDAHAPTALQGSLMLKEKVRIHAEGLALAEFRHGPVEVLTEGCPVILIGYGREKRDSLLRHADFLSKVCHAKVALVTECDKNEIKEYPNFSYVWDYDEELSHICATAIFQILAEHMAEKRGYDIDGFCYIGKILDQYEKPINMK